MVSDINGVLGGDILAARRITSPVADWPVTVVASSISTATSGSITTAIIRAQSAAIVVSTAIAIGVAVVVTTHVVKRSRFRWTARRWF